MNFSLSLLGFDDNSDVIDDDNNDIRTTADVPTNLLSLQPTSGWTLLLPLESAVTVICSKVSSRHQGHGRAVKFPQSVVAAVFVDQMLERRMENSLI